MQAATKILISSIGIPSSKIGSWVTRINTLIEKNDCFEYILSPSKSSLRNLYCKKGKFITHHKNFRNMVLLNWVAKDYLKKVKELSKNFQKITLVVLDDPHLVEAFTLIKDSFYCEIEIVFSFHGFRLGLQEKVVQKVDKILFLSHAGYNASKASYFGFTPEVFVVGNGVDSSVFYPLEMKKREKLRNIYGFQKSDKIIIWMANDRPNKGFKLFRKIALQLLAQNDSIRIMTIGTQQTIDHEKVMNVGRVANTELPPYLQMGDVFLFTSLCKEGFGLSMIEALKSGNKIIASNNGAITDVLESIPNTYIIDHPNVLEDWLLKCIEVISEAHNERISVMKAASIYNFNDWEARFLKAINS